MSNEKMTATATSRTDSTPSPPASSDALSLDEVQLRAQGHKGELPRRFNAFAAISLGFTLTNSWIGLSVVFAYPLFVGGGPGVFYGLLVAAVVCSIINAGLAELASAFPSSGGQYHFAFMVASKKYRAVAAFFVGWMSVLAWILTSASGSIVCAQICLTIASFHHPEFVATQWQTYLLYVLFIVIATCIVVYFPRQIPKAEMVFFFCTITGFVVFLVSVLARSKTKQPASVVFVDYNNITRWDDGMAFMLGVGTCMYIFLATDGATHLSEEIPNPGRNVPRAILSTMVIGMCTSFPWALALLFSTNDLTAVGNSTLPILEVYHQALGSKAGATVFAVWVLWIYVGAVISCITTTGRLTWAFARDGGVPFSKTFAKVHPTLRVPFNATLVSSMVQILYGLIYIGSTTAFNSIISMSILSLNLTYVIPQGIVLFRGRAVLPKRYFDLGPILGTFCNAFSCLWVALYTILFCFPLYLPAKVGTMNYLSVVLAGILIFITVHWFAMKRKTFSGPSVTLEGLEMALALTALHDAEASAQLQQEAEKKIEQANASDAGNEVSETKN